MLNVKQRTATRGDAAECARQGPAREFLVRQDAVSAVEFAFVVPVMILLMLAGFDLGRFILATQRVEIVAGTLGQMLSETAASPSAPTPGDGVVSYSDILNIDNSAFYIFPDVLTQSSAQGVSWNSLLQTNLASIQFTATPTGCTTACSYVPKVVWTYGGANKRACGSTIVAVADSASASPTSLPADVFGPGSLIVVDVNYTFQTTFAANYLPSIPIERSAYITPRYVPLVQSSGPAPVTVCP
jgi:Flp pilus assembly protein TadG